VTSASDAAGNASQRLVTFHVVATIGSLKAAVNAYAAEGKIARSTQNSLLEKLDDAQDALNHGKTMVVRKKLSDFIGACRQRVVAGVANVLVADAQYVLGTL
jgi:FIMAH domain-containing protein